MPKNNRLEGNPNPEAGAEGSAEGEQREPSALVDSVIQRKREEVRNEAPEVNALVGSGKTAMVGVLKGGGGLLGSIVGAAWTVSRALVAMSYVIVKESLKEIKEDLKENIVNPLLKKVGFKPLKIKKEEKKDDK